MKGLFLHIWCCNWNATKGGRYWRCFIRRQPRYLSWYSPILDRYLGDFHEFFYEVRLMWILEGWVDGIAQRWVNPSKPQTQKNSQRVAGHVCRYISAESWPLFPQQALKIATSVLDGNVLNLWLGTKIHDQMKWTLSRSMRYEHHHHSS